MNLNFSEEWCRRMAKLEEGCDVAAGVPMPVLEVQKFLRYGGTLDQLKEQLGIVNCPHPTLPLCIMNYDMIDSPKSDKIVRECRNLVLEQGTWRVVSKSFERFFNLGEMLEEFEKFDWTNCTGTSKEDGSLMSLLNYNGKWLITTRGSWAQGFMFDNKTTWSELFHSVLPMSKIESLNLDPMCTYVFEMCSVINKVVRAYRTPMLYLLAAFNTFTHDELPRLQVDTIAHYMDVNRPEHYVFKSQVEVEAFLKSKEETDATFEGTVLKDGNGLRFKAKTRTYFALHQMHSNGNIFLPQYLVPWALKENPDELLLYFPEVSSYFNDVKNKIDASWASLKELWEKNWQVSGQKEYALAIKHHPFASILFMVRKKFGDKQTIDNVKEMWRDAEDIIIARLFK